ncbi:MAG: hypothetical protein K2I28_06440 [Muribaculaceae bacterium]|nr:hypothetical protein [Muribaculaceae bacterium]
MSDKIRIFVSVKQQVNDITEVLRGLSAQIESMQKTIDSQHATICQINRNGQAQLKKIQTLERMLKKKDKELEELRKRLSKYEEPPKNSGNSSTPPSKEQMKDEIVRRTKSLRKPSGKKPGGQPGHEGNTLELNDTADIIVEDSPDLCDECGESLAECDTELDYITQIISLPELKPLITEVRHYVKVCRACGKRVKVHPERRRSNAVVYDASVKGLVVLWFNILDIRASSSVSIVGRRNISYTLLRRQLSCRANQTTVTCLGCRSNTALIRIPM